MRITRPVSGKILNHAEGMGVPSPESVRKRARELALIDGHLEPTEADYKRAFHELHGGFHEAADPGQNGHRPEDEMLDTISERDMVAPSLGHRVPPPEMEGSKSLGEELVAEGLDESSHDQMLQARRHVDAPASEGEE